MRYDGEHKARTRDRILKEAAAAIRGEGSDRMGLAAVMKRVGLTHGGFYAHFASKDDLLTAAIGYMFEDGYTAHFARAGDKPPREALAQFVEWYLSVRHVDARTRGCPIPTLAGAVHRLPAAAQRRFAKGIGTLVGRIATVLEELGLAPADATARAHLAIGQMVGTVAVARTLAERREVEEMLAGARLAVLRLLFGEPPPSAGGGV